MYYQGKVVTRNYKAAVELFKSAAENRHVAAQGNLGYMYQHGYGVKQDYARAHMWLNISASQGVKKALVDRNMLELKMNPADISKARELARDCVARGYKGC
jgi:hypothetical protein